MRSEPGGRRGGELVSRLRRLDEDPDTRYAPVTVDFENEHLAREYRLAIHFDCLAESANASPSST